MNSTDHPLAKAEDFYKAEWLRREGREPVTPTVPLDTLAARADAWLEREVTARVAKADPLTVEDATRDLCIEHAVLHPDDWITAKAREQVAKAHTEARAAATSDVLRDPETCRAFWLATSHEGRSLRPTDAAAAIRKSHGDSRDLHRALSLFF